MGSEENTVENRPADSAGDGVELKTAGAHSVQIFMAGRADHARLICREYCDEVGFCVTVTPTDYVYKGGEEAGFIIGLINYPRFPLMLDEINAHALRIATALRERLGQDSFSIQYPENTAWYSWRDQ